MIPKKEYIRNLTVEDIIASMAYFLRLMNGEVQPDDIDHLGNRRLRSVGVIAKSIRIGLSRMERVVRERMTIQDVEVITPQILINIPPRLWQL